MSAQPSHPSNRFSSHETIKIRTDKWGKSHVDLMDRLHAVGPKAKLMNIQYREQITTLSFYILLKS